MASIYRVTESDALEAHEVALEEFGGRPGLSSLDYLLGALGRPYHRYHHRLHDKASALLHGVATSHAFQDGNKRTAVILTRLLIARSGYQLVTEEEEELEDLAVCVVCHVIGGDELVEWFFDRLVKE